MTKGKRSLEECRKMIYDGYCSMWTAESQLKYIVEDYFVVALTKTNSYHSFDYRDHQGRFYMIKQKFINYNNFNRVSIKMDKIVHAECMQCDCYFVFAFENGMYYYKYTPSQGHVDFIKDTPKCNYMKGDNMYVYIKKEKLILMDLNNLFIPVHLEKELVL